MISNDDLAAILPRRRDDEPPELRAQIVKELRDHLECAYQRELLRTGDESRAARRVQEQFGDARQLARKLWFEAMQEKIMSQRILIGLSATLAIACLALGGFALRIAQQTAEASAAATKALVDQGRETNQALLRALDRLVPRSEPAQAIGEHVSRVEERGEIRLKLVKGLPGGPPAANCQIFVFRGRNEKDDWTDIAGVSNAEGEFVAENTVTGDLTVNVTTPWGETAQIIVEVMARNATGVQEIICPDAPLAELDVTLDVQWPEDLRREHLGLLVLCSDARRIAGVDWTAVKPGDEGGFPIITTDAMLLRGNLNWGLSESPNVRLTNLHDLHAFPQTTIRHYGTDFRLSVYGVVILAGAHPNAEYRLVQTVRDATDDVDPIERSWQLTPEQSGQHVSIPIPPELVAHVRRAIGRSFDPAGGASADPQSETADGKLDPAEIDLRIEECNQAIRKTPEATDLYHMRALCWREKGDFAKAIEDVSEAIRREPRKWDYYSTRIGFWHEMREFDKELADLVFVSESQPGLGWATWALGRQVEIWEKNGEFQRAITECTRLIQHYRDAAELYVARGHVSQKAHSPANALLDYIEALARGPQSPDTHANLAWFYATAADPKYRNAKRSLKLATDACRLTDWRNWKALNAFAAAQAETGDFALAAAWQAKALEMNGKPFLPIPDAEIKSAESRLELYKAGKPWRDPE